MSKEAIKHYEAALKEAFPRGATGEVFHHWNEARYLIATEALDKMAENAKELGLDYDVKSDHRLMEQPAQQEPVAWMFEDDEDNGHKTFMQTPPSPEAVAYLAKWNRPAWVPLYTSPPAQRKPLTDEQILDCWKQAYESGRREHDNAARMARAIEAAHGIKENT